MKDLRKEKFSLLFFHFELISPDPLQASMNFVKILPKFDVLPRNMEDEKITSNVLSRMLN